MSTVPKQGLIRERKRQVRKFKKPESRNTVKEKVLKKSRQGVWSREIKKLKSRSYNNLDVAIEHLIQLVVKRFYPSGSQTEVEEVLKLYIENDPQLRRKLKKILMPKS